MIANDFANYCLSNKGCTLRVVFFGDSICVGQGVSIHSGWVTRIAAMLDNMVAEAGREIVVTNASVNGNTTRQALERMPYDVQSQGVDVMIVQFGMNDCNYWQTDKGLPRVSPGAFKANLHEIISRGKTFGAKHIFLHTNHPTTRTKIKFPCSNVTYEDSNKKYNSIIRSVATERSEEIHFTDIERLISEITGDYEEAIAKTLLQDELHLSRHGHDLYFDFVSKKISHVFNEILQISGRKHVLKR